MGVQNLWVLLAPVGRQIEIESLAGQVLAVDASIWLTQFVKAMRDDEGKMIRNAHLLGTFHRVAKLLFYGVRPVFVFDGQTPEIKKKTTARRRKRQEQQTANLRHTAQRLLLNRLKQVKDEMKKNDGPLIPAAAPGFTLPEVESTQGTEVATSEVTNDSEVQRSQDKTQENEVQMVWHAATELEDKEEDEAGDLTVDEIELDTSHMTMIDLHAVFSLPPHLQRDMIQKILRDRRQQVRNQFIPLAGNPEKYSQVQIAAFLQTSALNRRIEAAKRQKRAMEMEDPGGRGRGQRIDSDANRFYIYEKEQRESSADTVCQEEEKGGEEVTDIESKSKESEDHRIAAVESEMKQTTQVVKAEQGVDNKAKEIAAAWIARHNVRARQEPMLAIEKFRLKRFQTDESTPSVKPAPHAVGVNQLPKSDVKVAVNVDEIDSEQMARFQQLFPALAAPGDDQTTKGNVQDDEDDVEWEQVAIPVENESVNDDREKSEVKGSNEAAETSLFAEEETVDKETLEEDGEVEWEDGNIEVKAGDDEAEASEELFLTLRNEIEDAKGQEDLALLKEEALQSAMATASNLTQWAAGAVRRALQAHSLQHSERNGGDKSPDAAEEREEIVLEGSVSKPISLSEEEKEEKEEDDDDELKPDEDTEQPGEAVEKVEDTNEQLEAVLAASIANETDAAANQAGQSRVRYLQYSTSDNSLSIDTSSSEQPDTVALQMQEQELKKLRNRQLRDTEGITDEMVSEVMALLRLFGVPFLVSPTEAEAQCAALEQLGLVDGIITDDSDIFPFGGQRVYKNIFHHQKFVEAFSARDIERELGFSRDQLIALALLLGSDYTDGVRGIGIVNASEIVAAYPGIEGLREFKDWVREFNVAHEAQRVASKKKKKKKKKEKEKKQENKDESSEESEENGDNPVRTRFQQSHANARRRWEVGDEFPNKHVVQAYLAPQVDRSDARFSWSAPDLPALRHYCGHAFGWDEDKSDGVLQPLKDKAKAAAASGNKHIQTRLDGFFTRYDDQVHYARIQSKRLRSAIAQGNGNTSKKKQRK